MAEARTRLFCSLYRQLLRESGKFSSYNYRHYFLRRVKDNFHAQLASGQPVSDEFITGAQDMLALVKRQVSIGQMYSAPKMVLEKDQQPPAT